MKRGQFPKFNINEKYRRTVIAKDYTLLYGTQPSSLLTARGQVAAGANIDMA